MKPSDIEKEFVERVEKYFSPEQEPRTPEAQIAYWEGAAVERERIKKLIIEEIATAHKEGSPTKRLTSLYNKI